MTAAPSAAQLGGSPTEVGGVLLDLLAPRRCPGCDQPGRRGFCAVCEDALIAVPPGILSGVPALALARHEGPAARAVWRLKYEARSDVAAALAPALAEKVLSLGLTATLVPVPVHPRRLTERGHDQAALLAGAMARHAGFAWSPTALARVTLTTSQVQRGRLARSQVAGAFRARAGAGRVVLVDDVLTTGSTALAALEALRGAGAEAVAVVTVTRA